MNGQEREAREPLSDWLEKRGKQPHIADLRYYEARLQTAEAALAAREDTDTCECDSCNRVFPLTAIEFGRGGKATCPECRTPEDTERPDGATDDDLTELIEMPRDLARVLKDPGIIVKQDAAVFELIAKWQNAPTPTMSGPVAAREDTERSGEGEHWTLWVCNECGWTTATYPPRALCCSVEPHKNQSMRAIRVVTDARMPSEGVAVVRLGEKDVDAIRRAWARRLAVILAHRLLVKAVQGE